MLDRRLGVLLLGAGALGLYAARGLLSPTEVEFTRAAAPAPATIELRPAVSTVHVALPVDLARVAQRTEAALKQRLSMGLDSADATCARRPAPAECNIKLDNAVSLSGPVEATLNGTSVRVRIPLKIDAGQGAERTAFETSVSFLLRVSAQNGLEVSRIDETTPEVAGSQARLVRLVETRLRPVSLTAQDELRSILASLPIAAATQRAWNALAQPLELGTGSGSFLRAIPEVAGSPDLASVDGKAFIRVPIAARLSIENGDRSPAAQRRALVQGQVNTAGGATVRIASPIRLDGIDTAIRTAFVDGGTIETKPDRFGPPVKVAVRQTRLYPAVRQLALEMDIAATKFEGQTFRGKAHLVGRPVLDAEQRIMTLADVTFPSAVQREAGNAKMPANAPRLASEPFAAKLAAIVRVDLARDIAEAAPRTSNSLNQRIDDRMSLSARLDKASAIGIETSKDGAWLVSEVSGNLSFVFEGAEEPARTATRDERSAQPQAAAARKPTTPEIAAAAVVTAAAAAGASTARSAIPAAPAPATTAPAAAAPLTSQPSLTNPEGTQTSASAQARRPQVKPSTPRPAARTANLTGKGAPAGKREWVPWVNGN